MASGPELRKITKSRIRTVVALIKAREWVFAGYVMGHTLECALKAATCRTLKLADYPPIIRKQEDPYFKTHQFEQLLVISGLGDLFNTNAPVGRFQCWSDFTLAYTGEWVLLRYDGLAHENFSEGKVKYLFECLFDSDDSIIRTIMKKRRW